MSRSGQLIGLYFQYRELHSLTPFTSLRRRIGSSFLGLPGAARGALGLRGRSYLVRPGPLGLSSCCRRNCRSWSCLPRPAARSARRRGPGRHENHDKRAAGRLRTRGVTAAPARAAPGSDRFGGQPGRGNRDDRGTGNPPGRCGPGARPGRGRRLHLRLRPARDRIANRPRPDRITSSRQK